MKLFYSLYPSGSITSKAITLQIALVYLSSKVDYAILYHFNLIQKVSFHLALDVIDKNPGVSEFLLEKILELKPHD